MFDEKTKFCTHCGTMIPYTETYCPSCNMPQPALMGTEQPDKKSGRRILIATVLSFLVTGLGQVYLGDYRRGIAFFVGTVVLGTVLSYVIDYNMILIFGVLMAVIAAYDAYRMAST